METKNWTVYEHICPNGKRYIGITCKKPEIRWNNGRGYEKGTAFRKAINKYGWDKIHHNIVSTDLTEKEAKWLENYLICYYRTFVGFKDDCKGYNMTLGGDGKVGWKHKDETKDKLSKENKGEKNHFYGKHHTEESKEKISKSRKGKFCGEKHPMYGKHHTKESIEKNRDSNKGKIPWNKGKKMSDEFCAKEKICHIGQKAWNKGLTSNIKGKHRVYREDGTYFYQ